MATKLQRAQIITPEELPTLRRPLPASWAKAAGILKGKRIDPVRYQRAVRQEWERRTKKLEKLAERILHHGA